MEPTSIVLLVSIFGNPGWGGSVHTYPMESWDKCIEAVNTAKTSYSQGNESEGGMQLFCVNGYEVTIGK